MGVHIAPYECMSYYFTELSQKTQNIGTTELYDHCTRQDSAATIHECLIKHKVLEFKFSFHCVVYNNTTTTNVLIIVTLHKVAGALYISDLKNDGLQSVNMSGMSRL